MDSERVAKVQKLGSEHARIETECDLEGTMATLVADPVYEFFPAGLRMHGSENVRRYYQHLMGHFLPNVESADIVDEWCNENSLNQEFDVHLRVDGELERHRLLGVLVVADDLLSGERIYGSERVLRLMLGDLYDELEKI